MIRSDWDRWLIDEIEDATPTNLSLWYLGCNGIALKTADGTIAYVDPYLGLGDPPRTVRMIPVPFDPQAPTDAEAVFVTHEHTDHLHGPTQGPILAQTGAQLIAPEHALELVEERGWADQYDVDLAQFQAVSPTDTIQMGQLSVSVYSANDPDADEPVTYVFEVGDKVVVHAGDGRPGATLEQIGDEFDVDLAIIAVGSSGFIPDKQTRELQLTCWYNDPNEAIEAANQLGASAVMPTHWDMWKGMTTDPRALHDHARSFPTPERVEIVEIGDRVDIS